MWHVTLKLEIRRTHVNSGCAMIHHNFAAKMQQAQKSEKKESVQIFILSAVMLLCACINLFQHF